MERWDVPRGRRNDFDYPTPHPVLLNPLDESIESTLTFEFLQRRLKYWDSLVTTSSASLLRRDGRRVVILIEVVTGFETLEACSTTVPDGTRRFRATARVLGGGRVGFVRGGGGVGDERGEGEGGVRWGGRDGARECCSGCGKVVWSAAVHEMVSECSGVAGWQERSRQ